MKIVDEQSDDVSPRTRHKDRKLNRKHKETRTEGNIKDEFYSDISAAGGNRF